jgi:hypothetical protein
MFSVSHLTRIYYRTYEIIEPLSEMPFVSLRKYLKVSAKNNVELLFRNLFGISK